MIDKNKKIMSPEWNWGGDLYFVRSVGVLCVSVAKQKEL